MQYAPAEVTIDRQSAGRRLIALPEIGFPLRLQPDCAPGMMLDSLSISIADTRRTFRAADFSAAAVIETKLRIPRRQVSPLAVDGFCSAGAAESNSATAVKVAGAYSASVSLRCASDAEQSVVYDTVALDVTLHCAATDSVAADGASGSDVSAHGSQDED